MTDKDKEGPKRPTKKSEWETESSYDEIVSLEELINMPPFKAASDASGGTATAGARLPTWLERKVIHMIELRGSPYMLKSDVYRDAIYIGLRVLNMRYKSDPDWATEAKIAKVIDKVNAITRIKTEITQFQAPIQQLWSGGDEAQAISLFEEFIAASVEITDDWKRMKQMQLIKAEHLFREIAERSTPEVKLAVFGDRSSKNARS